MRRLSDEKMFPAAKGLLSAGYETEKDWTLKDRGGCGCAEVRRLSVHSFSPDKHIVIPIAAVLEASAICFRRQTPSLSG